MRFMDADLTGVTPMLFGFLAQSRKATVRRLGQATKSVIEALEGRARIGEGDRGSASPRKNGRAAGV